MSTIESLKKLRYRTNLLNKYRKENKFRKQVGKLFKKKVKALNWFWLKALSEPITRFYRYKSDVQSLLVKCDLA